LLLRTPRQNSHGYDKGEQHGRQRAHTHTLYL